MKQLKKAFGMAPGSEAPELCALNWTAAPKGSQRGTERPPVDFQNRIDEIKNDPGLNPSDKAFLIHMYEASQLDEKAASMLDELQRLDKTPGGGSSGRRQELTDQLEAHNKQRQEIMDRLKKMQNDQAKRIRRLFEK